MTPQHAESKFIFDPSDMSLVWGRMPKKEGQLWKGESTDGKKMELVGSRNGPVAYWGWSPPQRRI